MKIKALLLMLGLTAGAVQAGLVTGDITLLGFRSDNDDGLSFVTWTNISAGTSIYFTDSGFFNDGTVRSSEDLLSWTAPVGGIAAGKVVVITCPAVGASSADVGTTAGSLNGLSASGDQIFAGTAAFIKDGDTTKPGSTYAGTLLYGLHFGGSAWSADATSTSLSALPNALNSAYLNQAVGNMDNGQYTGSRANMTAAQFKAAINNISNWTLEDGGATVLNSTDFSVIPEPATISLIAFIGGLSLFVRRRFVR